MFRSTTILTTGLMLALVAPATSANDDWYDFRERQRERYEDRLERERDRYEDWLDAQRDAREDYRDWLEDQRDWRRGRHGPVFRPAPWFIGGPAFHPRVPAWGPRYDGYRPGGFEFRGGRGRGISIRW
jgi:hypothetical protein